MYFHFQINHTNCKQDQKKFRIDRSIIYGIFSINLSYINCIIHHGKLGETNLPRNPEKGLPQWWESGKPNQPGLMKLKGGGGGHPSTRAQALLRRGCFCLINKIRKIKILNKSFNLKNIFKIIISIVLIQQKMISDKKF